MAQDWMTNEGYEQGLKRWKEIEKIRNGNKKEEKTVRKEETTIEKLNRIFKNS